MDRDDLEKMFCDYYQFVVNLTRVTGVDTDDVEDVANEAMMDAFEALDDLREPEKMKSWLRTIVKNEAKAYHAKKTKHRKLERALMLEAGNMDLSNYAAEEIAFREMMRKAEDAEFAWEMMKELDPVRRSIIYMKFWAGYTFEEIGEILNINPSTARSTYARCRKKLYDKYGDQWKGGMEQ